MGKTGICVPISRSAVSISLMRNICKPSICEIRQLHKTFEDKPAGNDLFDGLHRCGHNRWGRQTSMSMPSIRRIPGKQGGRWDHVFFETIVVSAIEMRPGARGSLHATINTPLVSPQSQGYCRACYGSRNYTIARDGNYYMELGSSNRYHWVQWDPDSRAQVVIGQ
jgi:hypothetical protein